MRIPPGHTLPTGAERLSLDPGNTMVHVLRTTRPAPARLPRPAPALQPVADPVEPVEPAPPPPGTATPTRERWTIWRVQIAAGHEPCFGTAQRFVCADTGCRLRARCLGLRAEWLR